MTQVGECKAESFSIGTSEILTLFFQQPAQAPSGCRGTLTCAPTVLEGMAELTKPSLVPQDLSVCAVPRGRSTKGGRHLSTSAPHDLSTSGRYAAAGSAGSDPHVCKTVVGSCDERQTCGSHTHAWYFDR